MWLHSAKIYRTLQVAFRAYKLYTYTNSNVVHLRDREKRGRGARGAFATATRLNFSSSTLVKLNQHYRHIYDTTLFHPLYILIFETIFFFRLCKRKKIPSQINKILAIRIFISISTLSNLIAFTQNHIFLYVKPKAQMFISRA